MTTAGRQPYWTFGVFVYAVLLLLIAVPFLMTYRAGTVIADVDRFADPAAKAASRIQAELSQRGSLSEDERGKLLEIIHRSAERMNRLIEDLIAVGRVREGQAIPLKVQPEHPGDVISEACRLFAAQARAKSIYLECDRPHMVPTVRADRHRLLQVFSNLLENAIKFTPEGGRITVSCQPHDDKVRFAVSDTGRGIEHQDLTKIFDLFWQARPTAHLGSGFGLAIAKAIVEQHGGNIWAESTPGLGTTFFFTLPQAAGKEERLA